MDRMLYGGDYNPEQWMEDPRIWEDDIRWMKEAGWNTVSLGMFSWAVLEPREGEYDFSFLDAITEKLYVNGIHFLLGTPSGSRPAWMSKKYPEVLRVREDRVRILHGGRHNHCYTSPIYREKTTQINRELAKRYGAHPGLVAWHISNEYGGACYCDKCQQAFREYLRNKYDNDIDRLNHEWWLTFRGHRFGSFEEIEFPNLRQLPNGLGENAVHGLTLDFRRFVTSQTIDFMKAEIAAVREFSPHVPVTTNLMDIAQDLDQFRFGEELDLISWDNYTPWHNGTPMPQLAAEGAFNHDLHRSIKRKPFLMLESTPSHTNWQTYNKPKKPGVNHLTTLQAAAHGADGMMYFQWRMSRGSTEKFHGAVIAHSNRTDTRVFREVARTGKTAERLCELTGATTKAEAAVIYDWENRWAVEDFWGLHTGYGKETKKYIQTCLKHYFPFWQNGINTDVIDRRSDFSPYKLIVAPMLYMTDRETIEKIKAFVAQGGVFVGTYLTGEVNENDLCWLDGFPAEELKEVFGLWGEEFDVLLPEETVRVDARGKSYQAVDFCEVIHPDEDTEVLATYGEEFYKGTPAVCRHHYGKGTAYYIAFRDEGAYLSDLYGELIRETGLESAVQLPLPEGATCHTREKDGKRWLFIENYNDHPVTVTLKKGKYTDIETGETYSDMIELEGYEVKILVYGQ